MAMVQNQYDELVESGAYDREHEAWTDFTVDESQLAYMRDWLDARFSYLDGEINAGCGTWDVDENAENQFVEVFPNPAKERINIRFAETCMANVSLYDMTGRLVCTTSNAAQTFVISTEGFAKGIYTLIINTDGQQSVNRVVVK